jgi:predicted O-methyltransferase YrrM
LEVGTYTGVQRWQSRAMHPDGKVVACVIDATFATIAERCWRRAGVGDKIERLGPARDTLEAMLALREANSFDLCLIDADKEILAPTISAALRCPAAAD